MVGADISDWQKTLASLGFSPGLIDGIFGLRTDEATRAFQAARELTVDGAVGPATRAAARPVAPTPDTTRPGQVPKVLTALSDRGIVDALSLGHGEALGTLPSHPRLMMGWSHIALENAHGRALWNHNFGNISAFGGWPGPYYVIRVQERIDGVWKWVDMKFRSYADSVTGAADYWRLMAGRYASALARFDFGDANGAAYALSNAGYFTARADQYAKTMSALYHKSGKI